MSYPFTNKLRNSYIVYLKLYILFFGQINSRLDGYQLQGTVCAGVSRQGREPAQTHSTFTEAVILNMESDRKKAALQMTDLGKLFYLPIDCCNLIG